ncbi:uncharacterized protein MYCGRDRAFT_82038 [Zymoseptoria tritici IPO323]|uniref:Uncharacterized protein n=1 Tax=Zymoseptoria tritici (strain CBS 115943 / IPO323) TaxID=336722 RepID=F9XJU0_ZYMTI|nr:uncharacterized protein MYCGRDRAFT_82038 [Zymoseptoria tritici IPO323]EGP84817.1 hypothetical protein MYCGRDRAFT_82038 [Zymoseptoria tritici IPO323]
MRACVRGWIVLALGMTATALGIPAALRIAAVALMICLRLDLTGYERCARSSGWLAVVEAMAILRPCNLKSGFSMAEFC